MTEHVLLLALTPASPMILRIIMSLMVLIKSAIKIALMDIMEIPALVLALVFVQQMLVATMGTLFWEKYVPNIVMVQLMLIILLVNALLNVQLAFTWIHTLLEQILTIFVKTFAL